jgi:HEAT repeat protein
MSQSKPEANSALPGKFRTADDSLPPVEPPSAAFLVQLFVVPAVIVCMIVIIWFAVTWMARGGEDPKQYVDDLQRSGPARFQTANNLAAALADKRHEELKHDTAAAQKLADILTAEINGGSMQEQDVTLRQFLCKALGEFYVPTGVPVLLKAATTQRKEAEIHVRRAAIESLAVLAGHLQEQKSPQKLDDPELESTLLKLSTDTDPTIRYTTAMALGVIGGKPLVERLHELLRDENIDVRYNAALGLARQGDEAAVPMLLAMLEPVQADAIATEKVSAAQDYKRVAILSNAMRATVRLHKLSPNADIKDLTAAIEKLSASGEDERTRLDAKTTLMELKKE